MQTHHKIRRKTKPNTAKNRRPPPRNIPAFSDEPEMTAKPRPVTAITTKDSCLKHVAALHDDVLFEDLAAARDRIAQILIWIDRDIREAARRVDNDLRLASHS